MDHEIESTIAALGELAKLLQPLDLIMAPCADESPRRMAAEILGNRADLRELESAGLVIYTRKQTHERQERFQEACNMLSEIRCNLSRKAALPTPWGKDFDFVAWCAENGLNENGAIILARAWHLQAQTKKAEKIRATLLAEESQSPEA